MPIPFYTSTREYQARKAEFDAAVLAVLAQGDFILGSEVQAFEREAAAFLGARFAVGVASGSDALVLGADLLGLGHGAEVLMPTFTFFASASCVARLGGKPVFVDLDPETLNMDLDQAARKLTPATRGILPVHLFLQPTPMHEVLALARTHGLKVLEDAAEAWGMECQVDGAWHKAGTLGHIGAYSFFPTKTLGAYGDAGLMVTGDPELAARIRSYRVHGCAVKYVHEYIGYNSRMDTLQAAILRVKLRTTEAAIAARRRHAEQYREGLAGVPGLRVPGLRPGARGVYYVFNILAPRRDELAARLHELGVGTSIYYPRPLHLQSCFSYLGHRAGDFPVAERVCGEILALPMYPELREDEISFICEAIRGFYGA